MPTPLIQNGSSTQTATSRRLYDRYGAMLLGYLVETLKDRHVAEECLINIFSDLAALDNTESAGNFSWLQLRQFAKERMSACLAAGAQALALPQTTCEIYKGLTEEQRWVFYYAYQCSKPIADIAGQMNKPEAYVRKVLAEAFTTIRKA